MFVTIEVFLQFCISKILIIFTCKFKKMQKVAIGIDIGGTNTVFGVVDSLGNVLYKDKIHTSTYSDAQRYISELAGEINKIIVKAKEKNSDLEVVGIGVGAPNGNYYSGTIEYAPNLNFKGVVPVVELLKKHFNFPAIILTNDANAAAIGEMIYGGAKNIRHFIMITLGTGVGSGLVVNGDMVYGHDGFAGELGHVIVVAGGRECGCGRRGCLETYTSAGGIKRTAFELMAEMKAESKLRDIQFNSLTAKMIYDNAKSGDVIANEAFKRTGWILGKALSDSVAHTSPEAIFLFGGLADAGDLIFKPTKEALEENVLPIFKNKVKILPSQLDGGNAAILGASALVWKELSGLK